MKVQEQCVVSLRYCLRNGKGEVVENIMNGPAITYVHGEGKILSGLEGKLVGLEKSEKKYIQLRKTDYPGLDDDFKLEVIIDHVRAASADELKYGISQSSSADTCGDDCACYQLKTS